MPFPDLVPIVKQNMPELRGRLLVGIYSLLLLVFTLVLLAHSPGLSGAFPSLWHQLFIPVGLLVGLALQLAVLRIVRRKLASGA